MTNILYANANTTIRIKESELLTQQQIKQFIQTESFDRVLHLLKGTAYDNLTEQFNDELLEKLVVVYDEMMALTPNKQVVELFSLIYTYHNLKVLLKEKLTQLSLANYIIPIGTYSLEALTYLVQTNSNDDLPVEMVEAVRHVVHHYETFEQVEAIDVLLDSAYFKQLYQTVLTLQDDQLTQLIRCWIDCYNVSVVMRTAKYEASRSLLVNMLVDNGDIDCKQLIQLARDNKEEEAVALFETTSYAHLIAPLLTIETMRMTDVEQLKDAMTHLLMKEAKYSVFGHMPLLAYIFYKEMDIKNLRLILTGKVNRINEHILHERMKPTYDV